MSEAHRVQLVDLHGQVREKVYANKVLSTSYCETLLLHDLNGRSVRLPGYGHATGHMSIEAVCDAPRTTPYGTVALTRLLLGDGTPHPLCSRSALLAAQERLAGAGWHATVGFELEYVVREEAWPMGEDNLAAHLLHGVLSEFGQGSRLALALLEMSSSFGLGVQSVCREFDPGQYELTTEPMGPLDASDSLIIIKNTMAEAAHLGNVSVDLTPQPASGRFGNGLHINISLRRADQGDTWPIELAEACAYELGRRMIPNTILFVPRAAGYDRLRNPGFSGLTDWSNGRRDALVRLVANRSLTRIELRLPDPTANHFLCLAMALNAIVEATERPTLPHPPRRVRLVASVGDALRRFRRTGARMSGLHPDLVLALMALARSQEALTEGTGVDRDSPGNLSTHVPR